jgi:hypothetical protein
MRYSKIFDRKRLLFPNAFLNIDFDREKRSRINECFYNDSSTSFDGMLGEKLCFYVF